jgi:dTDP-4-amino-4,6-dideoxygalactose transaminase
MRIPQADLRAQYEIIREEIDHELFKVIESTQFVRGWASKNFEENFANYCQARYSVGVANGTDAITLALRAIGVGNGDEVITTPFTFTATCEAIYWIGAKISFVDIDK